jgi:hypothetical protein
MMQTERAQQSVTKVITMIVMNLVAVKAAAKLDFFSQTVIVCFNKSSSLTTSLVVCQICQNHCNKFGHSLLRKLSLT